MLIVIFLISIPLQDQKGLLYSEFPMEQSHAVATMLVSLKQIDGLVMVNIVIVIVISIIVLLLLFGCCVCIDETQCSIRYLYK